MTVKAFSDEKILANALKSIDKVYNKLTTKNRAINRSLQTAIAIIEESKSQNHPLRVSDFC